ncbi:hypothetical protein DM02DRAFT_655827 [Periconia macrospinosa]|uniref:Uncharacterized protein n=1 Tax=Periconia macrospinosa TaxID=97972 RepID=A0A2V1DPH1_9PLEO|nr:hypothetical protein DM02DRAFT_655827 [Periconia macrospinosa]
MTSTLARIAEKPKLSWGEFHYLVSEVLQKLLPGSQDKAIQMADEFFAQSPVLVLLRTAEEQKKMVELNQILRGACRLTRDDSIARLFPLDLEKVMETIRKDERILEGLFSVSLVGLLKYWIKERKYKLVEFLLDQPDLNSNMKYGNQEKPLLFACKDKKMVKLLLAHGADIEARDRLGRNVLYANKCLDTLLDVLLRNGAKTDALDKGGNSVLIGAAIRKQPFVLAALIRKGTAPWTDDGSEKGSFFLQDVCEKYLEDRETARTHSEPDKWTVQWPRDLAYETAKKMSMYHTDRNRVSVSDLLESEEGREAVAQILERKVLLKREGRTIGTNVVWEIRRQATDAAVDSITNQKIALGQVLFAEKVEICLPEAEFSLPLIYISGTVERVFTKLQRCFTGKKRRIFGGLQGTESHRYKLIVQ